MAVVPFGWVSGGCGGGICLGHALLLFSILDLLCLVSQSSPRDFVSQQGPLWLRSVAMALLPLPNHSLLLDPSSLDCLMDPLLVLLKPYCNLKTH